MLGFFKYPGSILLTVENVPDFKIQDATLEIVIESENFLINRSKFNQITLSKNKNQACGS